MKKFLLISILVLSSILFSGCSKNEKDVAKLYFKALKDNNPDYIKGYSTTLTYVQLTEYIASKCLNNITRFEKNVIRSQLLLKMEQKEIPLETTDVLINNKIIDICKNEKYFDVSVKVKDYDYVDTTINGDIYEVKYKVTLSNKENYIKSVIMKYNVLKDTFEIN